jgi:hypothetical protein
VRQRIQREDHEEFLFSLYPVFVKNDGSVDDAAARICLDGYSSPFIRGPEEKGRGASLQPDKAFEIAKGYLQEKVKAIWDWEEDVSLLNLASVEIGP